MVDEDLFVQMQEGDFRLEDALRTHGTSEPLWRLGCGVAAAANVSALDLRVILIQE